MRKILLTVVLTLFTAGLLSTDASAHSLFMKALKAKYEFKSVSCSTCHSKKDEIAEEDMEKYKEDPKHFRNSFGQLFMPHIKGKKIDDRVEEAKELKKNDMDDKADELEAGVTADFLEALEKVEAMKNDAGKTYAELLKAGEIDGIRLPE